MAKTLRGTVNVSFLGTYDNSDPISAPRDVITKSWIEELLSGAGDFQIDRMYRAERSLGTGASEDLDPVGVLLDVFGEVLSLSKLKLLIVKAHKTNTTSLTVRSKAATGAPIFETQGDGVVLEPGGLFVFMAPKAGVTLTGGTADIIQVVNSAGATAKYDVLIAGTD